MVTCPLYTLTISDKKNLVKSLFQGETFNCSKNHLVVLRRTSNSEAAVSSYTIESTRDFYRPFLSPGYYTAEYQRIVQLSSFYNQSEVDAVKDMKDLCFSVLEWIFELCTLSIFMFLIVSRWTRASAPLKEISRSKKAKEKTAMHIEDATVTDQTPLENSFVWPAGVCRLPVFDPKILPSCAKLSGRSRGARQAVFVANFRKNKWRNRYNSFLSAWAENQSQRTNPQLSILNYENSKEFGSFIIGVTRQLDRKELRDDALDRGVVFLLHAPNVWCAIYCPAASDPSRDAEFYSPYRLGLIKFFQPMSIHVQPVFLDDWRNCCCL